MLKKVFPSVFLIFFTLFFYYIISPLQTNIVVASSDIVNPNQKYTYNKMVRDIKRLAKQYPSIIHYETIGKSEYGRPIYAVSLGKGKATVFINGIPPRKGMADDES
ncbi:M14 family zinc carboxypeptidase [Heyndrickxia sporothermodurans]